MYISLNAYKFVSLVCLCSILAQQVTLSTGLYLIQLIFPNLDPQNIQNWILFGPPCQIFGPKKQRSLGIVYPVKLV